MIFPVGWGNRISI